MPQESTTVRVSRRTHHILSELAERQGSSVSDLLERLAERERRSELLGQYNTRMAEVLADPAERAVWLQETALSEVSAAELMDDPPAGDHAAVAG